MRKNIMYLLASVLLLGATSCTSCVGEKQKQQHDIIIEDAIQSDYNYMEANHAAFVWYEAQITLSKRLDEDNDAEVLTLNNVFQFFKDGQPNVVIFTHTYGGCDTSYYYNDFWIEDCAITTDDVKVTFKEAYDNLMKANYVKPHSINCTLRKPVGPRDCNALYIFGNTHSTLFVDAINGKVSDVNPAFGEME